VPIAPSPEPEAAPPGAAEQPDDLWERIRLDLSWQDVESTRVDKARNAILRQSNYMAVVSNRADYYLYYIVEEVQKRDMPVEIALIPVVESTLNPFASSSSGAAGLWQIMPATGDHLGLEQDRYYDGRQALRDSTTVALDYLEDLHGRFDNDWLLALAAYNYGVGNVTRARKENEEKGLGTDYWSLKLPRQAHTYVPKLIALAQIVAEPERFDVEIPVVTNVPSFEVAELGGTMQMAQAAELAGVDVDTLRALNPGQIGDIISPYRQELLLPAGTLDRFEYNIAQLSPEELVQWKTYRIKSGDSLDLIARKFDTDVAVLQQINGIHNDTIRAGSMLKIPADSSEQLDSVPDPEGYSVRAGDSLYLIAGRYKVSVNDIIAWNALDPAAYLKPGQKLRLQPPGG
jgi:membrane-bound lytic murein transglycosylase D